MITHLQSLGHEPEVFIFILFLLSFHFALGFELQSFAVFSQRPACLCLLTAGSKGVHQAGSPSLYFGRILYDQEGLNLVLLPL